MSASHRFYSKINQEQVSRPLYRGCPRFGGSVIRGFTVQIVLKTIANLSCDQNVDTSVTTQT